MSELDNIRATLAILILKAPCVNTSIAMTSRMGEASENFFPSFSFRFYDDWYLT